MEKTKLTFFRILHFLLGVDATSRKGNVQKFESDVADGMEERVKKKVEGGSGCGTAIRGLNPVLVLANALKREARKDPFWEETGTRTNKSS